MTMQSSSPHSPDAFVGELHNDPNVDDENKHFTTGARWILDNLPSVSDRLARWLRSHPEDVEGVDLNDIGPTIQSLYEYLVWAEHSRSTAQTWDDARLQNLLHEGKILAALSDLVMSDKFYSDTTSDNIVRREVHLSPYSFRHQMINIAMHTIQVLAKAVNCLSYFVRIYKQWEAVNQDKIEQGRNSMQFQFIKRRMPQFFQLMWQNRHKMLPLPLCDEPPWKLHYTCDEEQSDDNLLERAVNKAVFYHHLTFIESP